MIQIVKSLLGKSDIEYQNELQLIITDENKYILSSDELDVFKYLNKEFTNNKQFPTEEVFLIKFPQYRQQLNEFEAFDIADLRYYRKQFITKHQNIYKSKILHKMATDAVVDGITPEMAEAIRKQTSFVDEGDSDENISFRDRYTKSMRESSGLKTYVDQIDQEIGSITKGSVCTLAGFTGSCKCVSENERILTNKGLLTIKEIYNIGVNKGLKVQSEYGFKDLIAVHDEGVKDSYIISIGSIPIETSPVHRFRIITDNGELVWKQAKDLNIGDKVVQTLKESKHGGIIDDCKKWQLNGESYNSSVNKVFPKELYYLDRNCWKSFVLGFYKTNKHQYNHSLGFYFDDKLFLLNLSRLLSGLGISSCLYKKKGNLYYLQIHNDKKSNSRFVNIINYNNTKHKFNRIKYTNNNYITNNISVKQEYFDEYVKADLIYNEITSIEHSKCYMYDLTVSESPTYVLNGYVTHNTTWAVNMAVKNALEGKNIAYISLEVTKEQLEYSILSLFSTDQRFLRVGYSPLEHIKIRQNKLTEDELNFLFDVLEPEYRRVIEPNLHILDESKFHTFSESEILDVLYKLDDEKPLDAVFIDHVGLLAFKSPLYSAGNVGVAINKYVSFVREISICFRVKNGEKRSLASVLLAQTNRTGFKEAERQFKKLNMISRGNNKNNNHNVNHIDGYSKSALSDANELERCSSVLLFVYTDEMLKKELHKAYVQLAKTRWSSELPPLEVAIDLAVYRFGGDATIDEAELGADWVDSLASCSSDFGDAGTDINIDDSEFDL